MLFFHYTEVAKHTASISTIKQPNPAELATYKEWTPGLILHVLKQRGFVDTERWIGQPAVQI